MDKRVVMIIAILIVGIGCMYFIVDNSNTIGNAITTFSKTSVTLPSGFSVSETNSESAELYNKQSNETIDIHDKGKGNHTEDIFKNVTETYNNNPEYSNLTEETKNVSNIEVFQLNMVKNNTTSSCSVFYHYNHTYLVEMSGFDNINEVNKNLEFIITTLQPDYKQAQD